MSNILLDSSVIVDYLRVKNKETTLFRHILEAFDNLYLPLIGYTELFSGKSIWERAGAREDLEAILSEIEILSFDEDLSVRAGEIRAKYNLHIADAIVAATAIKHKLKLATLNIKDFKKIKGLKILKYPLEN